MSRGRGYFLTSALCLVFLLSGCTVWKNKNTDRAADKPSTVRLTLLAEPDINPNEKGEPAPTEIAVVYLSEDSKLLAADYDQLGSEMLKKTLSKNYIDHQEYTLLPNQYKPLSPVELEGKNNYLGVIAYYADANRSEWKKIIKINSVGYRYGVLIHVRANDIDLRKEEE
ncbi:type VI secretion system protein VasD [Serratia fonticola]|uniref:Type VI secretion system protein VasD n=1 Tax=Serratia fonticola TaxID=47917 RepID=A0A542D4B6_SERFO|nr:type VI secretion system lipoprotein TssJ [Serratia fonticola]TQI80055.1 type VI secretion system protein VasD [Serratia fonticola]TQI97919.1 type VI secretion system protein VasD [Serratia fonticola]TVZ72415.1 type VI secretion system protein VasD [Serratia fonticola]